MSQCLSRAFVKLFTKEDPVYLHKTLGIISLISFVYRYLVYYVMYGDLGFGNDLFSWVTMMLHLALSTSSLIFHVLRHRIVKKPMIIWEEYRLHAIVFSVRCVSVFAFGVLCPDSIRGQSSEYFALCMLVLAHHLVVDWITANYGTAGQTTIRVKDKDSLAIKIPKLYYGFYQFSALGSHLLISSDLPDLGFNTLVAIQSSAFLMTLYRKGLIEWYSHAAWYTACLVLSHYHMARVFGLWFFVKIAALFFLRVRYRVSKYMIWTMFAVVHSPWGQSMFADQVGFVDTISSNFTSNLLNDYGWSGVSDAYKYFDYPSLNISLTSRAVLAGLGVLIFAFQIPFGASGASGDSSDRTKSVDTASATGNKLKAN